jgi:hypothetical protein
MRDDLRIPRPGVLIFPLGYRSLQPLGADRLCPLLAAGRSLAQTNPMDVTPLPKLNFRAPPKSNPISGTPLCRQQRLLPQLLLSSALPTL